MKEDVEDLERYSVMVWTYREDERKEIDGTSVQDE